MARHVQKGDMVIVTAGNDRGATGEILRVLPTDDRVVVQGVNVRSKHIKPTQVNPQGGVVRREMPIHISNVSPIVDGAPTRVRFEIKPDGTKTRVAVKGGKSLHTLRGPTPGARAKAATAAAATKTEKKTTKKTTKKKTTTAKTRSKKTESGT
jgi:large subunit ribosomal protein L24